MNYQIIVFKNNKEILRRETNNRKYALWKYNAFCNTQFTTSTNDKYTILLYYKGKRIKTFSKEF